jgi:hypothetical protein
LLALLGFNILSDCPICQVQNVLCKIGNHSSDLSCIFLILID